MADQAAEFVGQFGDRPGEVLDPPDLVAGDPDSDGRVCALQAGADALLPDRAGQCSGWDLPVGPEVVQLPAQFVDEPGSRVDQALAVHEELAYLELRPGQSGGREPVDPLAQGRAGDRK